jgi:hypothetical protein
VHAAESLADDHELVAAQPRNHVAGPQDLTQSGRESEQEFVAGSVPERVVDDLETVEIEHQRRDVDPVAASAAQCVLEAVERHGAVRQPGQGIVARGVPAGGLLAVALNGGREDVGDRGEKVHVVVSEGARSAGVGAQHAERPLAAFDDDAHATDDAVSYEQRRPVKSALGAEIGHHDGSAPGEHVARFGARVINDLCLGEDVRAKADAGHHLEALLAGCQRQDRAELQIKGERDGGHNIVHEGLQVAFAQRGLAQLSHAPLLARVLGQASFSVGPLRDVTDHGQRGLDPSVLAADGHGGDDEPEPVTGELELTAFAVERALVALQRHHQHLARQLALKFGDLPSPEHVLVNPWQLAHALALRDQDSQISVHEKHRRVRQVCRQGAMQQRLIGRCQSAGAG